VQDDRGVTIQLDRPAQRIVTLLPSLTETVCELKACDRLVGTDRYSNWPAQVLALPKTGGMEDANVERIVALKPDLVLAAVSTRAVGRLEGLGLKVAALEPKSHADMRRVIGAVARLLGQDGDEALWRRIEQQTREAAAKVPASMRGQRVYVEVDASPYAAGPASFVGETLAALGLGNVVSKELGPFPKLNPEFVVRAQPDILIGTEATVKEMPARPGWQGLTALKTGRTCGFAMPQFEVLIRPGPRLGEAAQLLAGCFVKLSEKR
jgi:iron complex transport system substrate-binding protein